MDNALLNPTSDRHIRCVALLGMLAAGLVVFSGCAGYHLGPTNGMVAGAKSVQIKPFVNRTIEPRLTDPVTQEMRQAVQRDGTFRLSTHGDPDLVMEGVLTKFDRNEVTFAANDILTVQDYRLILTAQVTVTDRSTGKVILSQPVSGYTLVRVGADLTSAERQALPLLAGDLARNAIALLADGKW